MRRIDSLYISWDVGEGRRRTMRTRAREIERSGGENAATTDLWIRRHQECNPGLRWEFAVYVPRAVRHRVLNRAVQRAG